MEASHAQQIAAAEAAINGPINDLSDADHAAILAHLSLECEPQNPLPNRNSLMMEVVKLRNALANREAAADRAGYLRGLREAAAFIGCACEVDDDGNEVPLSPDALLTMATAGVLALAERAEKGGCVMKNVIEIISDAEVDRVHGRANFGGMTPREVLADGVLKYAYGYSAGYTQLTILREHGLIRKPKPGSYYSTLTKKGQEYLRAAWPIDRIRAEKGGAA